MSNVLSEEKKQQVIALGRPDRPETLLSGLPLIASRLKLTAPARSKNSSP